MSVLRDTEFRGKVNVIRDKCLWIIKDFIYFKFVRFIRHKHSSIIE